MMPGADGPEDAEAGVDANIAGRPIDARITNDGTCCWLAGLVQILLLIWNANPALRIGPPAFAAALYDPLAWRHPARVVARLRLALVAEGVMVSADGQRCAVEALSKLVGEYGDELGDKCMFLLCSETKLDRSGCAGTCTFRRQQDWSLPSSTLELCVDGGSRGGGATTMQRLLDDKLQSVEEPEPSKCEDHRCPESVHAKGVTCAECKEQYYSTLWSVDSAGGLGAPPSVLIVDVKRGAALGAANVSVDFAGTLSVPMRNPDGLVEIWCYIPKAALLHQGTTAGGHWVVLLEEPHAWTLRDDKYQSSAPAVVPDLRPGRRRTKTSPSRVSWPLSSTSSCLPREAPPSSRSSGPTRRWTTRRWPCPLRRPCPRRRPPSLRRRRRPPPRPPPAHPRPRPLSRRPLLRVRP
jgi:hypothetical protein